MDRKSLNIVNDKIEQLKTILPEAITEGKIDWEKLRLTLGDDVNVSDERYVLNWAGKSDAFRALQSPTTFTLAPIHDESINFVQTENIFIEGENLEVLKILQKSYYGEINVIYIDPPYNTGNDSFVYPDRFSESREEYLKRINDKDQEGFMLREGVFRKNSKDSGHYHSNWLSMMYPRLFLARNLMADDGIIFVSIDDNENHNLRLLMNDVFGEENFVADIVVVSNFKGRSDKAHIATAHDRLLVFKKPAFEEVGFELPEKRRNSYNLTDEKGNRYRLLGLRKRGGPDTREERPNLFYPIFVDLHTGEISLTKTKTHSKEILPKKSNNIDGRWRWKKEKVDAQKKELVGVKKTTGEWDVFQKDFLLRDGEERKVKPKSVWFGSDISTDKATKHFKKLIGDSNFTNPKPVPLIKDILEYASEKNGLVLDFFAGSGTTAEAVLEMNQKDGGNRKFILIQLPEPIENGKYKTIAEIAKERIRRVVKKVEETNPMFADERNDLGFKVFKQTQSNFKLWRGDGIQDEKELEKQLDILTDPVRPEAVEENVLFELLLKSGYPLTTQIEKREVGKSHYYLVDSELAIALSHLGEDMVQSLLEATPQQVICLDSLFENDDPLKTNTQLQFKDAGIEFHSI